MEVKNHSVFTRLLDLEQELPAVKVPAHPAPTHQLKTPISLQQLAARAVAASFDVIADTSLMDIGRFDYTYVISPFNGVPSHLLQSILNELEKPNVNHFEVLMQPSIVSLDLSASSLAAVVTDVIIRRVCRCTMLRRLVLARCKKVSSTMMSRLLSSIDFNSLHEVNLSTTRVDDSNLQVLGTSANRLTILRCSQCYKLTSKGCRAIILGCPILRVLDISYCQNITRLGAKLGSTICELNISGTAIGDDSFESTGRLDLRGFSASHTNITDASVKNLWSEIEFPSCRYLNLSACGISEQTLTILGRSPHITTVDISATSATISRQHYERFISVSGRSITELNLSGLHDVSVPFLASSLPRLRKLNLENCTEVWFSVDNGQDVKESSKPDRKNAFKELRALYMAGVQVARYRGNENIVNLVAQALEYNEQIEELDISRCTNGNNVALFSVKPLHFLKSLRLLDVSYTKNLRYQVIEELLNKTPKLERLGIDGCEKIQSKHLKILKQMLPWLQIGRIPLTSYGIDAI